MDENEAESETDKQAALAGNDRNLNGKKYGGGRGLPLHFPLWSFTLAVIKQSCPNTTVVSNPSFGGDFL